MGELMEKVLISLPDQLAIRMRATIPPRQRSKIITHLIEKEIERREASLYKCALAVEQDSQLRKEMEEWDIVINDGLNEDS
jgi:metal-responsive CopG/Arc/MetJ family transcriptional regulator